MFQLIVFAFLMPYQVDKAVECSGRWTLFRVCNAILFMRRMKARGTKWNPTKITEWPVSRGWDGLGFEGALIGLEGSVVGVVVR
jgi:hypothetical protein